jgi:hypothetical protein
VNSRTREPANPRTPEIPLPWERVLWTGRPVRFGPRLRGERYFLTDLRLARVAGATVDEIVLNDIGDVLRTESRLDRLLGTSTVAVVPRRAGAASIVLSGIRRGAPLAALLELLSGDPHASTDVDGLRAALRWNPRPPGGGYREVVGALTAFVVAVVAVAVGLHGKTAPAAFAADDAIEPNGVKKSRAEITRFMETDVMPWARQTLARLKGGPDRVTCDTCHGAHPEQRNWHMPSVAALPLPELRDRGWEVYNGDLDAQVRNAIYGYVAESDNQEKVAYMRETVMPGMARLLHRPPYDFARTYDFNRSRRAFGCYHCHRVK